MLKQMTLMNVVSVNRTAQYNNELNINITTYFFIIKKKSIKNNIQLRWMTLEIIN